MRLRPLLAGEVRLSPSFVTPPRGPLGPQRGLLRQALQRPDQRWSPVPVFLLEHPSHGPILVDAGYAASVATDPAATLGPASARIFRHRAYDVDALLARAGHEAGDVSLVVMTHLHGDHASGLERFPTATVAADAREWLAGERGGRGLSAAGYVPSVVGAVRRRSVIDFADAAARPHGPFDRTLDLLGDGSLRLLSTPGHTPGHMSVLVRLGDGGEVLLTGDAADWRSQVAGPVPTSIMSDEDDFMRSLRAIRDYAAANPQTVVVPGHDPVAWHTLQPVYG